MSTHLPADLFTPTEGSTYLLDGYPDTQYGEGTAHKWDNASVRGLAGIPDGVIGGDADWEKSASINFEGFTIPEELDADEHPDLVDHTWLDPEQPQDPNRLPKSHFVAVPELEEAWGKGRRTDGVRLISAVDKDRAEYEASLKAPAKAASYSKATVSDAIAKAWRRVTAGVGVREAGVELTAALGDDARVARTLTAMQSEVGLIGAVYIRADAYPKCASGKWADTVRKTACDAQYVQSKPDCTGCVMAQEGRCAAFGGRRLVTEVPYEQALEVYAPRIAAAGIKVATGNAKENLRRGLTAAAQKKAEAPESNFHVVADAAQGVSATDARRALASATGPAAVRNPSDVQREKALVAAQRRVAQYVRDGLVGQEDAAHLVRSVTDPVEMVRRASVLAARPVAATEYTGAENQTVSDLANRGLKAAGESPLVSRADALRKVHASILRWRKEGLISAEDAIRLASSKADPADLARAATNIIVARGLPTRFSESPAAVSPRRDVSTLSTKQASQDEVWSELREAEGRALRAQKVVTQVAVEREKMASRDGRRKALIASKVAAVAAEIERGVRGSALASFIHRTITPAEVREASVALDPILRRTAALANGKSEAKAYAGPEFKVAPQFGRQASDAAHGEVARLARWARRLMTEGVAGSELDHRTAARFAAGVRTAGTDVMASLRKAHEGLSGHLYVDAEAYATKLGTGGCEEGARHHRANGIPAVMEIPSKCGTCVNRTALADGTKSCSLYGKPLVKSAAEVVENPVQYQKDMIRLADAPDQDLTAALFANTFDESEFALGLDTELDHVDVDDMPEHEAVGQYMFGGIVLD